MRGQPAVPAGLAAAAAVRRISCAAKLTDCLAGLPLDPGALTWAQRRAETAAEVLLMTRTRDEDTWMS